MSPLLRFADISETLADFSQRIPYYVWNLLIAASALLLGLVLKWLVSWLVKLGLDKDNNYSFFESTVVRLGKPVNYLLPVIVLNLALPTMKMAPPFYHALDKMVEIALDITFAFFLIRCTRVLEDYVYHKYDLSKDNNLKERKIRTQLQFLRQFMVALIVFVTIAVVLLSFGNMCKLGTGLLTGVGVSGIIIGIAAQRSLASLLAGFQIAFTQPIRVDDVLVVEGEWGRVEEITLTYVVLKIWDQRRLILPITYFLEKPFQNWTRSTSEIMGTVFLYMDYSVPIEKIRMEATRLLESTPLWDKRINSVQVTDCKERVVEVRVLMSALNSSRSFDLRCYVREHLIDFIQKNYPEALPQTKVAFQKDETGQWLPKT